MYGGCVQVGGLEGAGMYQPSPLRKRTRISKCMGAMVHGLPLARPQCMFSDPLRIGYRKVAITKL